MRFFTLLLSAVLMASASDAGAQSHFSGCAKLTGNNATVLIPADASLTLDDDSLAVGSELAVFTEDGLCVGLMVWNGEPTGFPIWGDDTQTPEKDGLTEGDSLYYRIWDAAGETEIDGRDHTIQVSFSSSKPFYASSNAFQDDGIYRMESFSIESNSSGPDGPKPPEQPDASTTVELHPNYPNPFNPSTTIRYDLPEQAEVRITIFNTAGQEIMTLFDGAMPAGTHEIRWDAAGMTSGSYFCRLQAGSESRVQTMLLVK